MRVCNEGRCPVSQNKNALPFVIPRAAQPEVRRIVNIYCDESCHLENDKQRAMVIGAVACPKDSVQRVTQHIRLLKRAHGIDPYLEIKWTKVSPAKIQFYKELILFFFCDPELRFRCLVVPDKSKLQHAHFQQTHDEFYYKMYYLMLRHLIEPRLQHHIYLDIKDTRGNKKVQKLQDVLCNTFIDTERTVIARVQQIRSHESEILQLADILIGAVSFANRGLSQKSGKGQLVEFVRNNSGVASLDKTSSYGRTKFNVFVWQPQDIGQ